MIKVTNNISSARKDYDMGMTNRLASVFVLVAVFFVSITTAGCATAAHTRESTSESLELKSIVVDGMRRTYYIHFPPAHESSSQLPLVLVLHGGGKGDGLTPAKYLGFTSLADSQGFVVAYPNGIDSYWRDGRGYTHRGVSDTTVDDVGFISQLIDHLVREHNLAPKRVYVTGMSSGGMMTLRLGCELSSKLAAIAPVVANIPKNLINSCRPERALPVLVMNGTDDPLMPYNGGYVHFFRKEMGEVVSTSETVSFWVKHNGCNSAPSTRDLPNRNRRDRSRVKMRAYANPNNGCEVVLYTIKGGGHTMPGSDMPDRPRIIGHKNVDINGAKEIWEFFKRHAR